MSSRALSVQWGTGWCLRRNPWLKGGSQELCRNGLLLPLRADVTLKRVWGIMEES